MRHVWIVLLTCVLTAWVPARRASAAEPTPVAGSTALDIVSQHKALFEAPPRSTPSNHAVDAPLLGNGDLLAAMGGTPARLQFYLNKNDLWVMRRDNGSHPCPLARLDLDLADLEGASYRVEQDLLRAVTIGRFRKGPVELALEAGVAATENVLWVKLSAAGGTLRGRAAASGADQASTVSAAATGRPVQLGREQHGRGRWYLDGALDEVRVYDRVLPPDEIASLARKEDIAPEPIRSWRFEDPAEGGKVMGNGAFVPGVRGKALQCDGKSAYLDADPLKPMKAGTVSAFVKINRHVAAGHGQYILSQGEWNQGWSLGLAAGHLRLAVGSNFVQSASPVPVGQWVHIAGTFGQDGIRAYVDGKAVSPPIQQIDAEVQGSHGDVQFVERRFEKGVMEPAGATCAVRVIGGGPGGKFVVEPGKPVLVIACVRSRFDASGFREAAIKRAGEFRAEDLPAIRQAHEAWWRAFWGRSFVEIPDKVLEQRYYLSHYVLASASRVKDFPPGLFGWVTTDRPAWNGDYHLNYNHVAPFYGLYAANHIEQADPCHEPILAALEVGRQWSLEHCQIKNGVLLPVGIGPRGSLAGAVLLDQKSNSAYSCVPLAFRWYATYDLNFARKAYPFIRDTAWFWENWLKFEDGRYVIYKDAIHEGSGSDVNAILSLGLVRLVMDLAVDMSKELGVDSDRRGKWTHIRGHLSDYPTCTVRDLPRQFWPRHMGQDEATLSLPIFRYSEKGTPWYKSNTLGIQHIYPAGGIGLDSGVELLQRARNQIQVLGRWRDYNGMNSLYAAAVRVGFDSAVILQQMRSMLDALALPNGMIRDNPHGMEHQSIVPNAIQEMVLQSHEGMLRLFPCWPKEQDARFGTLRARGAFLVSGAIRSGKIGPVTILSEKGRDCAVVNPWPGQVVQIIAPGQPPRMLSGERLSFKTSPGQTLGLRPAED